MTRDTGANIEVAQETAHHSLLREMFDVAIRAVSAELVLPGRLPDAVPGKTLVLGVGKAGAEMARVAGHHMTGRIEGIVLTRYGHGRPPEEMPPGFTLLEAGHPLPDARGLEATCLIVEAVRALGEDDQLLMLVSGGTSALLTMPAPSISLADKQEITSALLRCGASISELNCVRTHLSAIKGGRLALAAAPARVVTLAFSDIPGDDPALVGSGPTVADRTKLADARRILELYGISVPEHVAAALRDPANETPFASADALARSVTRVVARSRNALEAAGELARSAGYQPVYLGDDLQADAGDLGTIHAALALHHAGKGGRFALLSGGETTVVVRNREGRGGRNGEYLLSLACGLDGARGIYALAADTDGIDGTEDNAGAIITPSTLTRAGRIGVSAGQAIRNNQSYEFFRALDDLIITGPTRTNVNDIRIVLIDR